jgi:hypothetical protein
MIVPIPLGVTALPKGVLRRRHLVEGAVFTRILS